MTAKRWSHSAIAASEDDGAPGSVVVDQAHHHLVPRLHAHPVVKLGLHMIALRMSGYRRQRTAPRPVR
jgi:hypothetical protein